MLKYRNASNGKALIESIKKEDFDIYERLYNDKKDLIVACALNDLQDEVLNLVNFEVLKRDLDEKFFKANEEEISRLLLNTLDFNNLQVEYSIFISKKSVLDNHETMTYEEIMMSEFDEDKAIYEKDFNLMLKVIKTIKNLYLFGNAGNGKTTFAYNVAKDMGLKLYNINSVKNEFSVKGFFDLEGNYQLSLYEKWYKDGGVLLLDEVDSYSSNGMLYLNNGIEVNSKFLTLEDGSIITKNPDCYVIACANTDGSGKTADFIGRNAIDKAFMSRFTKKEYKEYAHVHKLILGDDATYNTFKKYFDKKGIEFTCRLCVKIKGLKVAFKDDEILELIINKEIEL